MATVKVAPIHDEALKHFVINSALLYLIDPVRGKPTKGPLEKDPCSEFLSSHQLKQKFLDSFALICSTSRSGAETASAVCLEQRPAGSILRVARNHGLSPEDLGRLEKVLQLLAAVAKREKLPMRAESEILQEVVDLDKDRILSLVEKLDKAGIQGLFQQAISRLPGVECNPAMLGEPEFRHWLKTCPFTVASLRSSGALQMISLIEWASQARWVYPAYLQDLLAHSQISNPPWMDTLDKMARYYGAIKSMVKLAVKSPEVFTGIHVQAVDAPAQQSFSLSKEKANLLGALKRLVKEDWETTRRKLIQRWGPDDVEAKLRKACRLKLTLHAEMQLLVFYDCNPTLKPQLLHMGTSKKACYLCHEFLLKHPCHIRVSACHQKIYPTWMPPPCCFVPGTAKSAIFWNFSKYIERVTIRELKTGLVAPRWPMNKDSTAGPSLTTTATVPTEVWAWHMAREHVT